MIATVNLGRWEGLTLLAPYVHEVLCRAVGKDACSMEAIP